MNILFVLPTVGYRGGERIFYTLAKALKTSGSDVKIITARIEKENLYLGHEGIKLVAPPKFINALVQNDLILSLFTFPILFFLLLTNSREADIVDTESGFSLWASVLVGKLRRIKVVWTVFGLGEKPASFSYAQFFRSALNLINHCFTEKIDGCICISPQLLKRVQKEYSFKNLECIVPAIDEERFSKPNPSFVLKKHNLKDKITLLFPSVLHPKKNQELAIFSLKKILFPFPKTVLILLGGGKDEARLREIVKTEKLKERVIFAGIATGSKITDYYAACDLVLLPSILESEGLGLTAFEALINGKLPVVSGAAGAAEIIRKEKIGIVVDPNIEAFSKAIIVYLQNKNRYNRMVKRGKKWVQKELSVSKFCRRTTEFYNTCLGKN